MSKITTETIILVLSSDEYNIENSLRTKEEYDAFIKRVK